MSRLFKNIFYNILGQGLVLIISFTAVKYIFNRLGAEAFGIIYFSIAINTIFSTILELGVSSTIVREISGHFESDKSYIKDFVGTFSFFYWSIYIFSSLIIFFTAPFFVHHWIRLSTMDSSMAIYVLRILGISSLIGLPRYFYTSLIGGLQKMGITNLVDVITTALQQFVAILILILGGGFLQIIYWFAASYIFRVVVYFFISGYFFSFSALIPRFNFSVIKRNFQFTLGTTLITIFSMIHTQIDKIIISKLLPIATLGYYSFAESGVSRGNLVAGSVAQAAYPSFSALYKAGDKEKLMSQYHRLQDFICFGILPVFAFIPFALIPLFSYLLNANIAHLLLLPTTFLCVGFYMNGTVTIPYIFSVAVGKPNITAKANFYALFIVVPITVALIYYFGLSGAGFSLACYSVFYYIYGMPRICKECLEIKTRDWYLHIFKVFILAILTYGIAWLVLSIINNYSIFALAVAYIIASIIFISCSYFLISRELKETIIHYFKLIFKLK